ncbi:uncharacterized protein PHACADRAFT_250646 [Phanerochaete carnosa HHB-10118-sp]|uniref:DUF6699 domain-containing protein n=1 Tax=Phanerochaete carnosa (strain HHB-10118-sp) TaxID=650164 RepID=K5VAJ4_PHACS|nr:uncharacterized protein PHACADRAFT_250646 [Phanerochaete carnosa HHB-10118-sp]EKM59871.1 hypothetical protein PHACADRAFT_250646 [Phanerochaete carnosa HHB-10118-sp]
MAAPYGYQAFAYPQTPYLWPYFQQPVNSPFIPPQAQLPPSPNAGAGTRRVRFEDEEDVYRPRPPSWHAGMVGTAPPPNPAPFPSPPMIYTQLPTVVPLQPQAPTHHRRYSDGALPQAAWVQVPTWMPMYPQTLPQSQPQLHPLLSAENGHRSPIVFDLSFHTYEPRKHAPGSFSSSHLTQDEFSQTATYPSVTRILITCDEIPDWRVVLEPYREQPSNSGYLTVPVTNAPAPPITVHDVLYAIHRMLHRQIRQADWRKLSDERTTKVSRAYTRRTRTLSTTRAFEESQGVKWVDYLEDKYMFRGLVRHRGEQSFEHLRLLVQRKD